MGIHDTQAWSDGQLSRRERPRECGWRGAGSTPAPSAPYNSVRPRNGAVSALTTVKETTQAVVAAEQENPITSAWAHIMDALARMVAIAAGLTYDPKRVPLMVPTRGKSLSFLERSVETPWGRTDALEIGRECKDAFAMAYGIPMALLMAFLVDRSIKDKNKRRADALSKAQSVLAKAGIKFSRDKELGVYLLEGKDIPDGPWQDIVDLAQTAALKATGYDGISTKLNFTQKDSFLRVKRAEDKAAKAKEQEALKAREANPPKAEKIKVDSEAPADTAKAVYAFLGGANTVEQIKHLFDVLPESEQQTVAAYVIAKLQSRERTVPTEAPAKRLTKAERKALADRSTVTVN